MFDDMLKSLNTLEEVQSYAKAQHNIISKLSSENTKLKEEVSHLKDMLTSTVPLIKENDRVDVLIVPDEEAIAKIQLEKIRELSFSRELTLEEAKRFEIFYKVLNSVRSTPKDVKSTVQKLNNAKLLELAAKELNGENE